MSLALVPIDLKGANELVTRWHRHHQPIRGYKFAIGVADGERVCGVAMTAMPVARHLNDGFTLEVRRVATDGTFNACSKLLSASWRAARALGYRRLITYTLQEEGGASLRAAGWRLVGEVKGRSWNTPSRPRVDLHPLQDKLRWEAA